MIVTAPAAFRYTFEADPEKHRRAAELIAGRELPDADENTLPEVLTELMRDVGAPERRARAGLRRRRRRRLVEGALKQQRLLVVSPREPSADDLAAIIRGSMENWCAVSRSRGRITSERTLNTASSRSRRATGRWMPSKCPSPR